MDLNSLLRFGNLAVNMLGTSQFKNMAKFVVPFLNAPAQPAPGTTGEASPAPLPSNPPAAAQHAPAANPHPMAYANPWGTGAWGAPRPPQSRPQQYPGMPQFGAPRPGMPGRAGSPRLGGLDALRGMMGQGAPGQRPQAGMGGQMPGLPGGLPLQNLMKYATPQNLQKVAEWQKVAKQMMSMFGSGSTAAAATTAAAASTASAAATGVKTASGRKSLKSASASAAPAAAKRSSKRTTAARSSKSKTAGSRKSGSKK